MESVAFLETFPFKIKMHVKQFGQIFRFCAEKVRKLG